MIKNKKKFKPGDFLFIEWDDAYSVDEWTERSDINPVNSYVIQSVGILVHWSEAKIILALNHDLESDNVSCTMHIPNSMVLNVKKLK